MARRAHRARGDLVLPVPRLTPVTQTAANPITRPPSVQAQAAGAKPRCVVGVDPELGFAGGEVQVLGLAIELRRAGHRADLLCDPRGALWRRAREAGVTCHPLRIRNAIDIRAGLLLRQFLRRHLYDVVHFHTARAHSLAPFARGLAGALVVTRRMDYSPNRLFAPYLYNRAVDGVAAISTGVADSLAAAGVARTRVTVIPSGVDCERLRPPSSAERAAARAALGIEPGEVAIGTVGALEARKGHRYLLQATAELGSAGDSSPFAQPPNIALRCFIAGEGSLRDALGAEISRLGLKRRLRLLGAVDDPRGLLWALDIFAFPSLSEGLGVALLEAMACGLPAVASRAGGIGEVVEHERTGLLVAPADSAQLAAALARLAAESNTRETFGRAARLRVIERFSRPAMACATLALYRLCLERRGRS